MSRSFRNRAGAILLIIVASCISYYNSFQGRFLDWDDKWLVLDNPYVTRVTAQNLRVVFLNFGDRDALGAQYLPLTDFSYMLDRAAWDLNPVGFHVTNWILHTLNAIAVFLLLRMLFRNDAVALIAALLFAVHPIQTEVVDWIAERKGALGCFFFLLSAMLYVAAREKRCLGLVACSVAAYFLAMLSKSTAFPLPLILILVDLCFPSRKGFGRRTPLVYLPFFAVAGGFAFGIMHFAAKALIVHSHGSPVERVMTMAGVLAKYMQNLVAPTELCTRHPVPTAHYPGALQIAGMALGVGLVAVAVISYFRKRHYLFCVAWFLVCLGPVSNIVPIIWLRADRYLYIPSIGAFAALALAITAIVKSRELRLVLAGGLVVVYSAATVMRNPVWRASLPLWQDVVSRYPDDTISLRQYGSTLAEIGRAPEGIAVLQRACAIDPHDAKLMGTLSYAYQKNGDLDNALAAARKALVLDPKEATVYYRLGTILEARGAWQDAADAYRKALQFKPVYPAARYNLSNVYLHANRTADAERELRQVVVDHPGFAQAWNNLAVILKDRGQIAEAIRVQREAVRASPRTASFHHLLGWLLEQAGDFQGAYRSYRDAAALDPHNPRLQADLDRVKSRIQ